ncbi:helix-turn-helix transcriptional regulator [Brucella gallinifaecis]|nr:AraC family transcriptional regulator [Brucella gallinifaecis]
MTDGLQPCLMMLRDIMGTPLIKQSDADLSSVRGLFWKHPELSLTTIYFPLKRTFLSAPGSREAGILILRSMSCPASVEQGHHLINLARGDVTFIPSDAPLLLTLPTGGRLDCAYMPKKAVLQEVPDIDRLFGQSMPFTNLPLQLLVTYAGYLLQHEHQNERNASTMVQHFYQLLPMLVDNLQAQNKQVSTIKRMDAIKAQIEAQISNSEFSIIQLAQTEGVTSRAIQKLFKRENTTFSRYLLQRRLEMARSAIVRGDPSGITQIAYNAGFDDPAYFSRTFRNHFGFTPSVLRRQVNQFFKGSV